MLVTVGEMVFRMFGKPMAGTVETIGWLAAVTTATSPAGAGGIEAANGRLIGLLAGGLCVLAGWVLLRILRPEKLFLRRVPARRNHVNLLHVLGLMTRPGRGSLMLSSPNIDQNH